MNNFKKIGLTALAASLVSTSVFAGELAVSGSAGINFENYQAANSDTAASNGTKAFSMGNQITFSGSGELDNGMNVSLSFVIDEFDNAETAANAAANTADSGSIFDAHSVTVSSDAMGTLKFSGEGGSSAQNTIDTTAAGDIWDLWDGRNGANSKAKNSNSSNNMFLYTLPSMVDGLAVSASYVPAAGNGASDTSYVLTYTGVEGLSVSYGSGSNDSPAGTATDSDTDTVSASYAYGPVTIAYSDTSHDSNTATADQDVTSFKLSYTVSDAISISYGEEDIASGTTTDVDASYSRISASYTAGGMTVSGNMSEMENGTYTTAVAGDEEYYGLSLSFAF
jgi:outer membrane protein OmpU